MGKLRLSCFLRLSSTTNEQPDSTTKESETAEPTESVDIPPAEQEFPLVGKKRADENLPFIPREKVRDQDGKEGRRLWIVVDDIVLDVTDYQTRHPGGRQIINTFGGQDCSWQWWSFHGTTVWRSVVVKLRVGRTVGAVNPFKRPPVVVGLRGHGFQDWP